MYIMLWKKRLLFILKYSKEKNSRKLLRRKHVCRHLSQRESDSNTSQ
jgi:hypothetical protein